MATELRRQRQTYAALPIERKQAHDERHFVRQFGETITERMDITTITSRKPPEPDIWCQFDGAPCYFEVSEVTGQTAARAMSESLRTNQPQGFVYSPEEGLRSIVQRKLTKTYHTSGIPIHLLLYYWSQSAPPKEEFTNLIATCHGELKALVNGGPFARVWIFDCWTKRTLFSR